MNLRHVMDVGLRRLGLVVALAIVPAVVVVAPASAAPPALVVQGVTDNACFFSTQDTDPTTGIAYGIVEVAGGSTDHCEITIEDNATGVVIADVTVSGGPAVVDLPAAGTYFGMVTDIEHGSVAAQQFAVTGNPSLPVAGVGAASAGGCTRSLEQRSIVGYLATYSTGWNVTSATAANSCSSTVDTAGQSYSATVATNLTQVALVDPFGIQLTKSVTNGGAAVSTASVGQTVVYRFTVTNTGTVPWTVAINDSLQGLGVISCPAGPLAAGASEDCTAPYTVTSADLAASPLVNTATASGTDRSRADATGASATSATASATLAITAVPSTVTTPTPSPGGVAVAAVTSTAPTSTAPTSAGVLVNTGGTVAPVGGQFPVIPIALLLAGTVLMVAGSLGARAARRR